MTKTVLLAGILLGVTLLSAAAYAADPAAGRTKFEGTCAACHGTNGISIAPIYPNLAGQKDAYLIAQLKAFRDGTRPNAIMAPMAKSLTATDIANVVAFLSSLRP